MLVHEIEMNTCWINITGFWTNFDDKLGFFFEPLLVDEVDGMVGVLKVSLLDDGRSTLMVAVACLVSVASFVANRIDN